MKKLKVIMKKSNLFTLKIIVIRVGLLIFLGDLALIAIATLGPLKLPDVIAKCSILLALGVAEVMGIASIIVNLVLFNDGIFKSFKENDLYVTLGVNSVALICFVIATCVVALVSKYSSPTLIAKVLGVSSSKLIKYLILIDCLQATLFIISFVARFIEKKEMEMEMEEMEQVV